MLKRLSPLPYLPGLSLALALAVLATWLAHFIPSGIISASVIALFLGMVLHTIKQPGKQLQQGIGFASKRLLKIAIVLLGASLDITTIMQVGGRSLMIMLFTLATCFGIGHFVGKALHLNWKMSNLISAGTGICGGSAIAAIAPVIDAEDRDIAFAMSATFLFDMVMILIFPLMGHALGMSDTAYGLWAGTAVNDTSSVVAAGYGFSEAAGDYAVMVKLTRTLAIIPTVLIFGAIHFHMQGVGKNRKGQVQSSIPYFILLFLAMAGLNSLGIIPQDLSAMLKTLSKFLMVTALAAIGLKTSLGDLRTSGGAAMAHGFIISLLVVLAAYLVIYVQQEVLFLI
ncbi:MAG: YeiH family protein [Sphaerochaeta sp.]|nr:YeiH family protein [uncultured Sphaerochaeta sp.]MDD3058505.1 YeiH family protein [Sphaerochaeta sp.]